MHCRHWFWCLGAKFWFCLILVRQDETHDLLTCWLSPQVKMANPFQPTVCNACMQQPAFFFLSPPSPPVAHRGPLLLPPAASDLTWSCTLNCPHKPGIARGPLTHRENHRRMMLPSLRLRWLAGGGRADQQFAAMRWRVLTPSLRCIYVWSKCLMPLQIYK